MIDEDIFESRHCRIQQITPTLREKHLTENTYRYVQPPRTDSFPSLNLFLEPNEKASLPKRPKSVPRLDDFLDDGPVQPLSKESYNLDCVMEKLKHLLKMPIDTISSTIKTAIELIIQGKSQLLTDILTPSHFLIISSIIQSHPTRHALVITPSEKFLTWARTCLIDSTAQYAPGKNQKAFMNNLTRGKIQVVLACSTFLDTLSLTPYDFIVVLKSELCESSLKHLSRFNGPIIFHQSPGYMINPPCSTVANTASLELRCRPVTYLDSDFEHLPEVVAHPRTAVIFSFKSDLENLYPRINHIATKAIDNRSNNKPVCGTTAILYRVDTYDHYVFVGCPPNLSLLLSTCYIAQSVSIVGNIDTIFKYQSFAHNNGADYFYIHEFISPLVGYRANSVVSLPLGDADLLPECVEDILLCLVRRGVIEILPYAKSSVVITVNMMAEGMAESALMSSIFKKGIANKRGKYTVSIPEVCNELSISPMQMESELDSYVAKKGIFYSWDKECQLLMVKSPIDSMQKLDILAAELETELHALEDKRCRQYDAIYSIIQNPDVIAPIAEQGLACPEIVDLPYEAVNDARVADLLKANKHIKWTPRGVARVLHGLGSPGFPYPVWRTNPYFGQQPYSRFSECMLACKRAVVRKPKK